MKKLILLIALCVTGVMSQAENINILIPGAPGGLLDWPIRELEHRLNDHGYTTETQLVNSCVGATAWLKNNPNKPAVMVTNPPVTGSGCELVITKNNFMGIAISSYFNICSMLPPDQAMNRLLKEKNLIGLTLNANDQIKMLKDLINTEKLNSKIIYYQGGPKFNQGLISGDVDFVVSSITVDAIISAGGNCFLTTGNNDFAKKVNKISLETISPGNHWVNSYTIIDYLGYNVDTNLVRQLVTEVKSDTVMLNKQKKLGQPPGGMFTGMTVDQQWEQHNRYLELFN
jgi:hypothetical protein